MRWHRHDRARAVPGKHVVGDPDRNLLAVHRVDRECTGGNTALLFRSGESIDLGLALRCLDVGGDGGALLWRGDGVDQIMFRCEHHEGCAVERVGARGEDAQLLATSVMRRWRNGEVDLGTFGATDPICLHRANRLRPVEPLKREELVGVVGDLEEPLREVALGNRSGAAPADAIDSFNLFACEGHLARRAPVDRRLLSIGNTLLVELQEDPLVPAEVDRVAGDDLALPIKRGAHAAQLAAHVLHVGVGPLARMNLALDRGVLGGETERVEADRVEDVEALHALVARDGVGRVHDVPVANVQVARWVWPHGEQVVVGLARIGEVGGVEPKLFPAALPARLNLGRVVPLESLVLLGHGWGSSPSEARRLAAWWS